MSTLVWIIILVVIAVLALFGFGAYKSKKVADVKKSPKIKVLEKKNFKPAIRKGLVLVDFWAAWCGPCKMMAPLLNEIADDPNNGITVAKVNVEYQKNLAAQFNIRSIPTLILFLDGKEVKRLVGFKTKKAILKEIKEFV